MKTSHHIEKRKKMKKILQTFFLLSLCIVALTGCSQLRDDVEDTADEFTGDVKILWNDVKDEFDQIEDSVENNEDYMTNLTKEDIVSLTTTIKEGYEKIKDGVTEDNHEEAKKVYEAASKLEYIKNNANEKWDDDEEKILELGEKTKELLKHYYGQKDGNYSEAKEDVEERLNKLESFSDEQWDNLKNKI